MSNFKFGNTNLEDQFQLKSYYNGGFRSSDCGYKIAGSDARNKFSTLKTYTPNNIQYSSNTGFKINGTDFRYIFAKKNEVPPLRSFQIQVSGSNGHKSSWRNDNGTTGNHSGSSGGNTGGNGRIIIFNCDLEVGQIIRIYSLAGGRGGYSYQHGWHQYGGQGGDAMAVTYKNQLICCSGGGGGAPTTFDDGTGIGGDAGHMDLNSGAIVYGSAGRGTRDFDAAGHGAGGGQHWWEGYGGAATKPGGGAGNGSRGYYWNDEGYNYYRNYWRNGGAGATGGGGVYAASGGGGGAGFYGGGGGGGVSSNYGNWGGGAGGGGSTYLLRGNSTYGNCQFVDSYNNDSAYVKITSNIDKNKNFQWNFGNNHPYGGGYWIVTDPYYSNIINQPQTY